MITSVYERLHTERQKLTVKIPEKERIKQAYERRKERIPSHLYSYFNPANLFIIQHREREIINALKRCAISKLDDKKILDLGCGSGGELRILSDMEQDLKTVLV